MGLNPAFAINKAQSLSQRMKIHSEVLHVNESEECLG